MAVLAIRRSASTPTISIGAQGGGGAYSPVGAAFDAVYTQNLYSDFGVSSTAAAIHSVTRASTKYVEDTSGLWTSVSANTLARSNKGALIEESRTNSIRNNSMQGAVAGTPGTLPTNWSFFAGVTGLTRTLVGTGVENGIDYIDLRLSGTPSGSGIYVFYFETSTTIVAANGQAWTGTAFLSVPSGSQSNISAVSLGLQECTVIGTPVTNGETTVTVTGSLSRKQTIRTLSGGGTVERVIPYVQLSLSGGAIDITLRIGWPQLELGAFATSPIRTTSAAVTRAADVITIDPKYASLAQGSVYVEWEEPVGVSANHNLFALFVDANNYIRSVVDSSGNVILLVVAGGVASANLSMPTAAVDGSLYKFAFRWGTDDAAIRGSSTLGTAPANDTVVTTPTGTFSVNVGIFGITNILNGYLRRLTLFPRKLTDAELGALVA